MFVILLQLLFLYLLILVVGVIEFTVAAPLVTAVLYLMQVRAFNTSIFLVFVTFFSLVLSSLYMSNWLYIFFVMGTAGLMFRSNVFSMQSSFWKVWIFALIIAVLITLAQKPEIDTPYIFHSLLGAFISFLICYKTFNFAEKTIRLKLSKLGNS